MSVNIENRMGTEPIKSLLIKLSLPMVGSMFVSGLYNVVDGIFISRISENALAAVALSAPIQGLHVALAFGTGVGVNAVLSKRLGEGKPDEANKAAGNSLLLGLFGYVVFLLFGWFFSEKFLLMQTDNPEIVEYGRIYLSICCMASIGFFGQLTYERLLQSTGKTFYSMISMSVGAVVNIVLDAILIFGYLGFPRMGIAGAAVATVLGQTSSMLTAMYFHGKKNDEIVITRKSIRPDWQIIKDIYVVGLPSIMMQAVGSLMIFGVNGILVGFSTTATAIMGIYSKLARMVNLPIVGLNCGMIPIISYNYGAQDKKRILETMRLSFIGAFVLMTIGLLVFQIFAEPILKIYNASADMMAMGIIALRILSVGFVFSGLSMIGSSVFQALGNGMYSLIVSLARQLVVLIPLAYVFSLTGKLNLVWWAFPLAEIVGVIISVVMLRKVYVNVIQAINDSRHIESYHSAKA